MYIHVSIHATGIRAPTARIAARKKMSGPTAPTRLMMWMKAKKTAARMMAELRVSERAHAFVAKPRKKISSPIGATTAAASRVIHRSQLGSSLGLGPERSTPCRPRIVTRIPVRMRVPIRIGIASASANPMSPTRVPRLWPAVWVGAPAQPYRKGTSLGWRARCSGRAMSRQDRAPGRTTTSWTRTR